MQFRKLNNISGWIVFAIALVTYLLTIEPTSSLWDCAEFIATSYKLEIGHPPGTPFFFLINRIAAIFAPSTTDVAFVVNAMSALESAFTILFLFWTISYLARKILNKRAEELTSGEGWAVITASAVGALAYTFSDTFWFSAVEAEVYALSSLFTAVVFWAIFKWEEVADRVDGDKWLILIAYLMGLSIGAHILNLLAIPAIVLVYYFRKKPDSPIKNIWKPILVSFVILLLFIEVRPVVASLGAGFDKFFVNTLGLPFNSGMAFFMILALAAIGLGVWYAHKQGRRILNIILLSVGMVFIGFSTYGVVLVRASANPPMNSNNPSNPYALKYFLNREQYGGDNPIFTGPSFASKVIETKSKDKYFVNDDGKYERYDGFGGYRYDPNTTAFFPRMHSSHHADAYKQWIDYTGKPVMTEYGDMVTIPTFGENMEFFFRYQVNHMYWRYFLWNFVGRQNDIQNDGILNGNWMSGIGFIDEAYLGPQDNLPSEMASNKGRNSYFFLPFILGMVGLFFHLTRDSKNFTVVMMLFLMTGLAIIVYLNQTPNQPRERDYAYAASFYAFAIWIGLGVIPVYELFKKWTKTLGKNMSEVSQGKVAAVVTFVITASVPTVLAVQNWDDHDYSGRTISRDMGINYLSTTQPQSILLNHGDNDTFATWFIQEVEEYRTDVRPLNGQYVRGDWYVDQMRIKANESEKLPIKLPRHKYTGTKADPIFMIYNVAHPEGRDWTIKEVMAFIYSDHEATKDDYGYDVIPARRIAVPVNKENAIKSGIVNPKDAHLMVDTVYLNLKEQYFTLEQIIVMDIIANSDWTRPIYSTSPYMPWLDLGLFSTEKGNEYSYLQNNGSVTLFTPIKTPLTRRLDPGRVDIEIMDKHLMEEAKFGNVKDPDIYVCSFFSDFLNRANYRKSFAQLANAHTEAGDTLRAVQVVDRALEELPLSALKVTRDVAYLAEAYWRAGAIEKGDALANKYVDINVEYIDYFSRFPNDKAEMVVQPLLERIDLLMIMYEEALKSGRSEVCDRIYPYLEKFIGNG